MKLTSPKTLKEIATIIDCQFIGNENHIVSGINEIHKVEAGDLVFVDHPKYYDKALNSAATTILINKKTDCPEGKGLLISEDPFTDFNKLTRFFSPFVAFSEENDPKIGRNTLIHPKASIGNNVTIGNNCIIHAGACLQSDVVIGNNVIIHANVVLGGDAFYYQKRENGYNKMHSCGRVVIEDDVEIGALCTIDKGDSGDTVIGRGSKLDSHVHVGHDTVIGKECLFASQVGIAGCVVVEDNVTLWGQVGVPSDIVIGKGAVVLGQSGLTKSVEGGKTYFGSPADEARKKFVELAMIRKIPSILEKL